MTLTKSERKKIAAVYRKAAEVIESSEGLLIEGCCSAIGIIVKENYELLSDCREYFDDIYMADATSLQDNWKSYYFVNNNDLKKSEELKNRRIAGLLLAAHLVEDGVEL